MNRKDSDRPVRDLFEELRKQEETTAPQFRRVLGGLRRRARGRISVLRLASVALFLALLGVWAYRLHRPGPDLDLRLASRAAHPLSRSVSLSDWKAPTDFLLRTPGVEILRSVPTLHSPVPDYGQLEFPLSTKGT